MALQGSQRTSRLSQMQMKFQQKQQIEREQKKLDMLGTTNRPIGKLLTTTPSVERDEAKVLTSSLGGGKVRQMFEERRSVGIDKSYPLKPISAERNNISTTRETNGSVRVTGGIKPLNHAATRPAVVKNNNNNHNSVNEFKSSSATQFDRDPLNNTIVIPKYNSTNRVPSLKSHSGNINNYNNNNNNNLITPKSGTVKMGNTTNTAGIQSAETNKLRKPPSATKSPPTRSMTQESATNNKPTSASPVKKVIAPPPEGMVQCSICGRNFNEDRIAKHETICSKTAVKKRKIFDSTKHRVQGTEAENYVLKKPKAKAKVVEKPAPAKAGNWRKKHEEFIQAIRAAKEMQAHLARGGKLSDLPPPPPSENPDYIQCPHCSRRFNQGAAERHIPKCATMLHNKPKPKPTVGRKR